MLKTRLTVKLIVGEAIRCRSAAGGTFPALRTGGTRHGRNRGSRGWTLAPIEQGGPGGSEERFVIRQAAKSSVSTAMRQTLSLVDVPFPLQDHGVNGGEEITWRHIACLMFGK